MNTILDEIIGVDLHEIGCGCQKCQQESHEHDYLIPPIFNTVSHGGSFSSNLVCKIEDLTPLAKPKSGAVNRSRTPRNIHDLDKVVLHQMAFSRGSDLNRYLGVTAHYIVMPDGKIGQLHPDSTYLNASDGFNSKSVAIEFAGNFPSTRGKCWRPETFGCHTLSNAQIQSGKCLLATLKRNLPNLKYVVGHLQSSASRSNDPGPDIWRQIGEWAISNLGYSPESRNIKTGGGKVVPNAWKNRILDDKNIQEEFHIPMYSADTETESIRKFRDLILFYPKSEILRNLTSRSIRIQRIEQGKRNLNLDYYPVEISQLPILNGRRLTSNELLDHIRRNFNSFIDTFYAKFYPFTNSDKIRWESSNPEGAIINIDIAGPDDASVVVGRYNRDNWIFITVDSTYGYGKHPVNGNRQFGMDFVNGKYRIFTRGVDAPNSYLEVVMNSIVTTAQENLWKSFQDKVVKFITDNRGQAKKYLPVIKNIPLERAYRILNTIPY